MSTEDNRSVVESAGPHSRRTALQTAGALLAGLGVAVLPRGVAAQATPTAGARGDGLLLVQSFGHGNLFPTQGDVGVVPYTVILWDAADQGFFFANSAKGGAGVVPVESVLTAIESASEPLHAVLVAALAEENGASASSEQVWAMRLVNGSLGSDPGAVTYQGEPLTSEDAMALLGEAEPNLPDGPQNLGAGYLILTGLSGLDTSGEDGVRIALP